MYGVFLCVRMSGDSRATSLDIASGPSLVCVEGRLYGQSGVNNVAVMWWEMTPPPMLMKAHRERGGRVGMQRNGIHTYTHVRARIHTFFSTARSPATFQDITLVTGVPGGGPGVLNASLYTTPAV